MKTTPHRFKRLTHLYNSYADKVSSAIKFTHYLEIDHKLLLEGYKFEFAIDFFDLQTHIFPFYPLRYVNLLNHESFVIQQVALSFVLHGLTKQVLLLPPYTMELRNFMAFESRNIKTNIEGYLHAGKSNIERKLENGLLREMGVKTYAEMLDKLDEISSHHLLDLGEKMYKEVLCIAQFDRLAEVHSGRILLRDLIDNGRLISSEKVFEEFVFDEIEYNINRDEMLTVCKKYVRKGRLSAAVNDCVGAEYLRQINRKYIGDKRICLFITHSKLMLNILKELGRFGINKLPEDYNFVRCPEYWIHYIMLQKGLWIDIYNNYAGEERERKIMEFHEVNMERVQQAKQDLKRFQEVKKALEEYNISNASKGIDNINELLFREAEEVLDKVRPLVDWWENLRLMRNSRFLQKLVSERDSYATNMLRKLKKMFISYMEEKEDSNDEISERIKTIVGIFEEVGSKSNENMRVIDSIIKHAQDVNALMSKKPDHEEKIFNCQIYFKDIRLQDFYNSIFAAFGEGKIESVPIVVSHYLQLQRLSDTTPMQKLCLGLLFVVLDEKERYRTYLREAEKTATAEEIKEVYLANIMIYMRENEREKCGVYCDLAQEHAPNDNRFQELLKMQTGHIKYR